MEKLTALRLKEAATKVREVFDSLLTVIGSSQTVCQLALSGPIAGTRRTTERLAIKKGGERDPVRPSPTHSVHARRAPHASWATSHRSANRSVSELSPGNSL
jgi:hypothetical protein